MLLSHYTSVETLRKIITSKTIRFTRLDHLDDSYEIALYASNHATKQYFVSCWSDPTEEIIPQWSMYGDNYKGVMIRLDHDCIIYPQPVFQIGNHVVRNSLEPNPHKMTYLQEADLKQRLEEAQDINKARGVNTYGQIAVYKSEDWSFQKEYRLILEVSKFPEHSEWAKPAAEISVPDFDYVHVCLRADYINNMQIMFGPLCSDQNKQEVNELIATYGLTNTPTESWLTGVIQDKFKSDNILVC